MWKCSAQEGAFDHRFHRWVMGACLLVFLLAQSVGGAAEETPESVVVPERPQVQARRPRPERPDRLIVLIPTDIVSTDPARYHRHVMTEMVQRHLYRRLLSKEGNGFGPDAATSFEAADPTTWVFEIAEGLRLQDGSLLDAGEAALFFERSASDLGGYPSPAAKRLETVERIEASGSKIVFHLKEPWPGLPAHMTREAVGGLDQFQRPVGSGPYRVARWDRGNRVILVKDGGASAGEFARIEFWVVPSAEERLRRVLEGEAHVAVELPPGAIWQLRRSPMAKAVTAAQSRVHFIEFDVTRPPFDDVRVRRALNLAVDTGALVQELMQDEAVPVATLLSPVAFGYDPSVALIGRDLIRAKELLADAGYPNGFAMELDAPASKRRVAEAYARMFADAGVDVTVRVWSSWSDLKEQILLGRRQAWLGEWGNSSMDPGNAIRPKLHSKGEANYGGYEDETLDALLDQADRIVDPLERLDRYGTIQRYLRQTAPMVFGYAELDVYGAAESLDWSPGPEGWLDLFAARWRP